MKKNLAQNILCDLNFKKLFRIMRLSSLFLFLVILHSHAETILSQTSVHLSKNSLTLNELIKVIEDQTEYLFVFSKNDVDINRHVSIKTKSEKVSDILEEALEGSGVSYSVANNYISLRRNMNDTPNPVVKHQQQERVTVKGVVEDVSGPIIGANVIERGTTNGTITALDGSFSLNVSPNATLIITYIGYKEQQIPH